MISLEIVPVLMLSLKSINCELQYPTPAILAQTKLDAHNPMLCINDVILNYVFSVIYHISTKVSKYWNSVINPLQLHGQHDICG